VHVEPLAAARTFPEVIGLGFCNTVRICASVADAPRDRAGVNVAVVDVPAVWAFRVSAAGEGGHAASKRDH